MSTNESDVNAVNERLRNEDHDQYGMVMDKLTRDDQMFREMAMTATVTLVVPCTLHNYMISNCVPPELLPMEVMMCEL